MFDRIADILEDFGGWMDKQLTRFEMFIDDIRERRDYIKIYGVKPQEQKGMVGWVARYWDLLIWLGIAIAGVILGIMVVISVMQAYGFME